MDGEITTAFAQVTHHGSGDASMAAALRTNRRAARPDAGLRITDQLCDIADVLTDHVQAVIFNREPPTDAARYLTHAVDSGKLTQSFRRVLEVGSDLHELPLPTLPGIDAFHADMSYLMELLSDLTDCTHVGLRIELLKSAMCPRFHVDKGNLRMLCTYLGPGTEVLDERWAARDSVLKGANGAVPEKAVVRCATGAVVLLKGEGLPGRKSHGAVHRSPAAPLRVLLAMDPLWLEEAA